MQSHPALASPKPPPLWEVPSGITDNIDQVNDKAQRKGLTKFEDVHLEIL